MHKDVGQKNIIGEIKKNERKLEWKDIMAKKFTIEDFVVSVVPL